MNKYWKYIIFPRFLDAIKDCTFINMDDVDLTATLNNMMLDAIQKFPFCRVSLDYLEDTSYDPLDSEAYGYYFVDENIGEPEYFVLITIMKELWVKSQITWDMNFKNPFFDKDIKGYSPAAMLTSMRNMAEAFEKDSNKARFNYNRLASGKGGKRVSRWGEVNDRA